jgi:hypothetical protein
MLKIKRVLLYLNHNVSCSNESLKGLEPKTYLPLLRRVFDFKKYSIALYYTAKFFTFSIS